MSIVIIIIIIITILTSPGLTSHRGSHPLHVEWGLDGVRQGEALQLARNILNVRLVHHWGILLCKIFKSYLTFLAVFRYLEDNQELNGTSNFNMSVLGTYIRQLEACIDQWGVSIDQWGISIDQSEASIYLVCAGDWPSACQRSPGSQARAAGGCRGSLGRACLASQGNLNIW